MIAAGLLVLIGAPALADPPAAPPARTAEEMIDTSKQVFGEQRVQSSCAKHDADEIVVCLDRRTDQRVPSTAQTDPNSAAARRFKDGGVPTAPQLDGGYCPSCQHFGSVPTPAYYVDVSALPQPPEGSDADRIAKGEVPAP
jgi:hypothetical protein